MYTLGLAPPPCRWGCRSATKPPRSQSTSISKDTSHCNRMVSVEDIRNPLKRLLDCAGMSIHTHDVCPKPRQKNIAFGLSFKAFMETKLEVPI